LFQYKNIIYKAFCQSLVVTFVKSAITSSVTNKLSLP